MSLSSIKPLNGGNYKKWKQDIGITACDKAKDFMEAVGAKFRESEKAEMGNLMTTLASLKFNGDKSVREHIFKLVETAAKLKDLEVPVDDAFVVHMALTSLLSSFDQLKISYNTQKEKWTLDELISICAQREERMKMYGTVNHINFVQSAYQSGKTSKQLSSYGNVGGDLRCLGIIWTMSNVFFAKDMGI